MKFSPSIGTLAMALTLAPLAATAQAPGGVTVASVSAAVKPAAVAPGGKGALTLTVAIKPGYHINSHKPNDPDLIATAFTPARVPGVTFGPARYPSAKSIKVSYEKKSLPVYEGRMKIVVPFIVAKSAKRGHLPLSGSLGYQGCNATSCYPPTSALVKASITIK